jgi:hypothetical protein
MCKHGNVFSLAVLIGREFDHIFGLALISFRFSLLTFIQFSGYDIPCGGSSMHH